MISIGTWLLRLVWRDRQFPRWMAAAAFAFAILALLAASLGAIRAWGWWHGREAIAADRAAANAEFTKRQLEAEREAGGQKRDRDAAEAAEQKELEDAVDQGDRSGRGVADDIWNGGLFD